MRQTVMQRFLARVGEPDDNGCWPWRKPEDGGYGRFWVNDADCLIAGPHVERREEWAGVVEAYSGLRASSDSRQASQAATAAMPYTPPIRSPDARTMTAAPLSVSQGSASGSSTTGVTS